MISDVFIEAPFDEAGYRHALTVAFGLPPGAIIYRRDGDKYPALGSCDAFFQIWPITGDYPVRATITVVGDAVQAAAEAAEATGAAWQSLADSLGCGICASSDDPEPWRYLVYRPGTARTVVEVDIDLFDDTDCLSMKPTTAASTWPRPG